MVSITERYGVDTRRLGGRYGVDQNARILTRFRDAEFHSMLALMAWMPRVAEWEVKKEMGRHIYDDSQHADQLRNRLRELRRPPRKQLRSAKEFRTFLWMLEQAPDAPSFLAGIYRVLKPKLISGYYHHIQATDPVADAPTIRVLERLIPEHEKHIRYMDGVIQAMTAEPEASRKVSSWIEKLEELFSRSGSGGAMMVPEVEVTEDDKETSTLSSEAPYFTPVTVAARDPNRFRRCEAGESVEYVKSLSAREKLMWQWHAGADNELMAGELGASSSRENLDFPWEFFMDMARLVWDEVRHTEIIEKRLEAMGGHMGMYPLTPGSYAYRFSLNYPLRATDLHLWGEARGQLSLLARRDTFGVFGDGLSSRMFDYIHADEDQHVYFGRRWVTEYLMKNEPGKAKRVLEEIQNLRVINGEVTAVPLITKPRPGNGGSRKIDPVSSVDDIAELLKEMFPEKAEEFDKVSHTLEEGLSRPVD